MANDRRTDDARDGALRALVADGVISPEQAEAVAGALRAAEDSGTQARWTEIVGFVGGGLVFAGAVALVAASWEDLTQLLRAGMLLVVAVVALVGGILAVGERLVRRGAVTDARRRIGGTLFVLTACTAAMSLGVATEPDVLVAPLLLGLVLAAAGYAAAPTVVGLLTCGVLSVWGTWTVVESLLPDGGEAVPYGLGALAVGLAWGALALLGPLPNRRTGLGIGASAALLGAQIPLFDGESHTTLAYALTMAVALLVLALHRWRRDWVLIVAGVVGVTLAVPEAIWDWTGGAIGGAAALLVAGLVLLAASGLGILLHRGGPTGSVGPVGEPGGGERA
ncbi:DUF2157 domain-containing protein [Actinorugispora endophytica]|uniref:Putative membrane protein DUF2157 n=1 Tax=Actinorugispora endophytica TaxID=1605990 RepID=A0A4R6UD89_9ACTN|nr:DUF2157 domain-containing protein [Actinorugispora endophytica]TDQ43906.1 putative membrane protein DUF2157 [Actinorugispora endophytica]